MIQHDQELQAAQERIAYFYGLLAQFRISASPENYPAMAGGYLAEIDRMHKEVLDYLRRHASEPTPAEAA